MAQKPVFFDPSGRRAIHVSRLVLAAGVLSTLLIVLFAASLFFGPSLGDLPLARLGHGLHPLASEAAAPQLLRPAERLAEQLRASRRALAQHRPRPAGSGGRVLSPSLARPSGRPLALGFYVNWDDSSYASLKRGLPHLDWVLPAWMSLAGPDMALRVDIDAKALRLIRHERPRVPVLPVLQNAVDSHFDGAGLARLLADPAARRARIEQIVRVLQAQGLQGVTVDFEDLPASAQPDLKQFLVELDAAFAPHGWALLVSLPFDDADWDYAAYGRLADYVLLMAYDQHWGGPAPGPVAGQDWYERTLDERMKVLDPEHTIVALGSYGYDWSPGRPTEALTFQDTMDRAADAQARVVFDPDSENPRFGYREDDGTTHQVWFLDGVTFYNQVHAADVYRPAGYALWRLGSEDPTVWDLLGRPYGATAPASLAQIGAGQDIDIEGQGEVLQIASRPTPGARTIEVEPSTGDVVDEHLTALPTSYVIQRAGTLPGAVALTFDDGPDPDWTPPILDVLKARHVPATFFIIGKNAEAAPGLVQRMVDEGHDVGNHTFTHPNLGETSHALTALELNATQRLFEALTGRSMRLFRAPYFGDAEPTTADELLPIDQAQSMGYLAVGLHVDPDDWQRPPAARIVQSVLDQVLHAKADRQARVILLHDGGGDRAQTVAALPGIIDGLRAHGYRFVTVSQLAGLTRDQAMPPLPAGWLAQLADRSVFLTLGGFGHLLRWLLLAAIWLGVARLLLLGALACVDARRERRRVAPALPSPPPLVSVLIPAYNEEKVIADSIRRLLRSRYDALEIIVVDDGSTDDTAGVVRRGFGGEPRVRLLTVPNGGKAHAVNAALGLARGSVVVALDADTQFEPETIPRLVRWFADPTVGAVAGNAKVGNRINLITCWQALEYITAQNLERRALAAIGAITVVPGAVGAWRRDVLERLGGFPADTLAEDQDLTLAVQRAGFRVLFDSRAVAWTEAPDSMRGLARQRFRWAYGTLQCLWKHRQATGRARFGALGVVALPQVWLFQILFSVVSPLVDLLLLWQVLATVMDYLQHRGQYDPDSLIRMALFYALFMLVDLAACVLAFVLERRERWRLLWWLVLQRFGYRQLMYYVVVRSVATAIRGPAVGWGRLERKATVRAGEDAEAVAEVATAE